MGCKDNQRPEMEDDPRIIELRGMREKARQGGGLDRVATQHAKGKFTARERLGILLDPGTFNELEPFITSRGDEMQLATEQFMGDGVVPCTSMRKILPSMGAP